METTCKQTMCFKKLFKKGPLDKCHISALNSALRVNDKNYLYLGVNAPFWKQLEAVIAALKCLPIGPLIIKH